MNTLLKRLMLLQLQISSIPRLIRLSLILTPSTSPGYMKPIIDDLVQTTQTIVDDTIEKQLTPQSGTVLSVNEETKTAVVQLADGKIVTVSLA